MGWQCSFAITPVTGFPFQSLFGWTPVHKHWKDQAKMEKGSSQVLLAVALFGQPAMWKAVSMTWLCFKPLLTVALIWLFFKPLLEAWLSCKPLRHPPKVNSNKESVENSTPSPCIHNGMVFFWFSFHLSGQLAFSQATGLSHSLGSSFATWFQSSVPLDLDSFQKNFQSWDEVKICGN